MKARTTPLLLLAVALATGGCASGPTSGASGARTITAADEGHTVRLASGSRLGVSLGAGWRLSAYPREVLRLTAGHKARGAYEFRATGSGSGPVVLIRNCGRHPSSLRGMLPIRCPPKLRVSRVRRFTFRVSVG